MIRRAIILVLVSSASVVNAGDAIPKFETHVRPILKTHCFQCHGEEDEVGGQLDLRLVRLMERGGESGAAVVPGQPQKSLLYQRLRDGEMPPDESKRLGDKDIAAIHDWIAAGAKTVRQEPKTIDAASLMTHEERSHWSFQPVQKIAPPTVKNKAAVANPIDAFLLHRLEQQGFQFSRTASTRQRVRRVSLDLLGLLPTPNAVESFTERDRAETEFERRKSWSALIDELLQSPHYGERWARHWLDVAGYADSEGYNDADTERPDAWRYRDYVIRSFNDDKPFDQFITEQLAGDELIASPLNNLSEADSNLLAATGFLRMAPDGTAGSVPDKKLAQNETIADTIQIMTSSLMGVTVGCAQCHDHRYDPISQADYYEFRAIFEPAFDWEKWKTPSKRRVSLYTDADRVAAAEIEKNAKVIDANRLKKQTEFIKATFEKQLAKLPTDIHKLARSAHATTAKKRTPEQKALLKKHPNLNVTSGSLYLYDKKAADELAKMAAKAKTLRATKPRQNYVRALTEKAGRVPKTHLFFRGNYDQPKQDLVPAGLTVVSLNADVPPIAANDSSVATTGRRLSLARRLTDPSHPLTARVLVNRIWRHHFGRGLVETPNDFGILGQPPTHPELLDWLASELVANNWSVKHIHRLILTSNAWQQSTERSPELENSDPENTLYGAARLVRLDAEVVRDCVLLVSGKLNTKAFGPPVPVMFDRVGRVVIGKENLNAGRPGKVIGMKGEEFRRSIYVQVRRSRPLSVLETFDRPAMSPNCDKRRPSTSSTQSLLMLNSDLLSDYSRHMADRVIAQAEGDSALHVTTAWNLVYSRPPNKSELQTALKLLSDQTQTFAAQPKYTPNKKNPPKRSAENEALAVMCQMLLSSNEFLYVD